MKTVIVTGANSGLGFWTSRYLMNLDYKVIMACRNSEKAQQSIDRFPEYRIRKNYEIKTLDLGDFDSIRNFVQGIGIVEYQSIFGLICNAGLTYNGAFLYTKNGIEETFGTNYLGHFLLTNLLIEKFELERIVFISSGLHDPKNKSPFAPAVFRAIRDLAYPKVNPDSTLKKQCEEFYATSKLCMLLFTYELERRLKQKNPSHKLLINAINPGLMLSTNLGRTNKPGENLYRWSLDFIFKLTGLSDNPENAAKHVVRLIDDVTTGGEYYENGKPVSSSSDSYDRAKAIRLWEGSEAIVESKFLSI